MKRILIAEDDLPSRELLSEILLSWGYEVVPAANGVEALSELERMTPDLILLDIQMPVLDGFGALAKLRGDPRFADLPVLAMTAYAMREDRERTGSAGFAAHISKPVDLDSLRSVLNHYLNGAGEVAGLRCAAEGGRKMTGASR